LAVIAEHDNVSECAAGVDADDVFTSCRHELPFNQRSSDGNMRAAVACQQFIG
jgi:hypothetical protein